MAKQSKAGDNNGAGSALVMAAKAKAKESWRSGEKRYGWPCEKWLMKWRERRKSAQRHQAVMAYEMCQQYQYENGQQWLAIVSKSYNQQLSGVMAMA
jgi:hypothetical protein